MLTATGLSPDSALRECYQRVDQCEGEVAPRIGLVAGRGQDTVVQIEVVRTRFHLAAWAMNCLGPQDASHDLGWVAWYAEVRQQHLGNGPDEVHAWRVGRNVLRVQEQYGSTASAAGGELV